MSLETKKYLQSNTQVSFRQDTLLHRKKVKGIKRTILVDTLGLIYEFLQTTSEMMIFASMIHIMVKRLEPKSQNI